MADRSLIPLHGELLVDDVGVDHHYFQEPEDLAPPLDRLVKEAVVAHELVHLVYTEHVLIVVQNGLGFLGCRPCWPESKVVQGKYVSSFVCTCEHVCAFEYACFYVLLRACILLQSDVNLCTCMYI